MKIPLILTRKKKLRASTARRSRSLGLPDEMDYEEMAEPNMKLSRALLIVLVLHIVAVAGIVAFNTIKTRENNPPSLPETAAPAANANSEATTAPSAVAADSAAEPATAHASNSPGVGPNEVAKATPAAVKAVVSGVKDSGKVYTVVHGDNPVTIARHLKVSEADLLALNQITDPRKLQINQKLRIPQGRSSSKAKGE